MNTSGDGFLAMFDGPQRAIRCATAIRDAVQSLGIQVRAGLHTGECELRGDDIGGIAVHIGARVSALAGPNEVLVSSTLRDLVIGSGLEFEDRGRSHAQRRARRMAPVRRRLVVAAAGETAGALVRGVGRINTNVLSFSKIAAKLGRQHALRQHVLPRRCVGAGIECQRHMSAKSWNVLEGRVIDVHS